MTVTAPPLPRVLVAEATVHRVERLSPAFVRIAFASRGFQDLNRDEGFDTRFKVVLPGPTGRLPDVPDSHEGWYAAWLGMPDEERSFMRTYTIRDVVEEDGQVLLVTDFAVHDDDPVHSAGPACRFALSALPGDRVQVVAPHRCSTEYGGKEFDPGDARRLLVVGDETAVPAVARILEDIGPGYTGHAFLEVPSDDDVQPLPSGSDVAVTWVPRGDAGYGRGLVATVRQHLGLPALSPDSPVPQPLSDLDTEVWETPRYSSSGEALDDPRDPNGLYAWIAGESWAVKVLRRSLVTELGFARSQVAFMGYWREGVAMRS